MTRTDGRGASTGVSRLSGLWPRPLPVIMGVINCTPDSFSDGGRFLRLDRAVAHGLQLLDDGAEILDVGGESTRPGAAPVPAEEEVERVLPVIEILRRERPWAVISVDTAKPEVAKAALSNGADLVNDVTAGAAPEMLKTVSAAGAGIILMHMRGTPRTMQTETRYHHVVAEVTHFLRGRLRAAISAGIPAAAVWLDPGIGFGKDDAGNLALLAALPELATLGQPVVVGPSRKSFIGRMTEATPEERLPGTLAALIPAMQCPRSVVRVHDPGPVLQFLTVARGIEEAKP